MKIAYVSFEYPPDGASGGIGTYTYQAACTMQSRGHKVEVFCGTFQRAVSAVSYVDDIKVNRITCKYRRDFARAIEPVFNRQHIQEPFDVVECSEYHADALNIKLIHPELPLVVKLHTPVFLINRFNNIYNPLARVKFSINSAIKYNLLGKDKEYKIARLADKLCSPSASLAGIVACQWHINASAISIVPNPYRPVQQLLDIAPGTCTIPTITFIGRLEIRKGLVELCTALLSVFKEVADVQVQFAGSDTAQSPVYGLSMQQYITHQLEDYQSNISFLKVDPYQLSALLSNSTVCVFPSIWENFPNVCLEAMSAGRAIVASREGGMSEMLEHNQSGLLVNPLSPADISAALIRVLNDTELRQTLGMAAREKVLRYYNADAVGPLMENVYKEAIINARNKFTG